MGSYRKKSAAVSVVGLVVLAVGLFSSSASAKTTKCLVINSRLDQSYSSLQAGVDAAPAGGTLWVRGTCFGTTTISKNLTVTGQHKPGFIGPTLDGGGDGHVLTITAGAEVAINTLTITHGDEESHGEAGGIDNQGTLTLTGATVTANAAFIAGAILNSGTLVLNSTSVTANLGKYCAGIVNVGTLTLNGSSAISHNTAYEAGGLSNGGTATLNDSSSISGNNSAFDGGGVLNGGTLTLNGTSSVSGNSSDAGVGGGIWNDGAVTLNGNSSVTGNTAAIDGGGIYDEAGATLNGAVPGAGGNVYNNSPNDIAP